MGVANQEGDLEAWKSINFNHKLFEISRTLHIRFKAKLLLRLKLAGMVGPRSGEEDKRDGLYTYEQQSPSVHASTL